jgi:hypothetical protein
MSKLLSVVNSKHTGGVFPGSGTSIPGTAGLQRNNHGCFIENMKSAASLRTNVGFVEHTTSPLQ